MKFFWVFSFQMKSGIIFIVTFSLLLGLIFAAYVRILWPYYRPCLSHFGKKSGSISVFGSSQM